MEFYKVWYLKGGNDLGYYLVFIFFYLEVYFFCNYGDNRIFRKFLKI